MTADGTIASLVPGATEILYGLGLGDRIAAVSHECDYPIDATTKTRATRSRIDSSQSSAAIDAQVARLLASGKPLYELDRDVLVRSAPRWIVAQAQCDVCAVRLNDVMRMIETEPALRQTEVIAVEPHFIDDVLADIRRIGGAVGCAERAERWIEQLNDRIATVRRATGALPDDAKKRTAIIEWIEPLMLAGNWTPQLIDWAGGRCQLPDGGGHSPYVEWQTAVDYDPQAIVVAACGFDARRNAAESAALVELPGWSSLSAVAHEAIWAIDGSALLNRSGPRLVDTLELLAHLLHPNLVPPPANLQSDAWIPLSPGAAPLVEKQ